MQKVKDKWYQKVLTDYFKQTLVVVVLTSLVFFILAVIQLSKGSSFVWSNIIPLEQPDFFERAIYSALTFVTLGAFLYFIRVYQLLSMLFGSNREGYKSAKAIIWFGLLIFMYKVIVPVVVNILNFIISFVYNLALLLLCVSPVIFIGLIIILITIIYCKNIKRSS